MFYQQVAAPGEKTYWDCWRCWTSRSGSWMRRDRAIGKQFSHVDFSHDW